MPMAEDSRSSSVSKNWLIGILTTLVLADAAGVWSQVNQLKSDQYEDRKAGMQMKQDVEISKERLRRVEDDTKEIRSEQRGQTEKLNELLRKVR